MSFFNRDTLSRQEQINLLRRQNDILNGPGSDNHKAMLIDNLYRERGLEPGSFTKSDESESGSGGSIKWLSLQLYFCVLLFLFCVAWGAFARRCPDLANYIWQTFITLWYDLGTLIFDWGPKALNYLIYKL